jgi:hypothetical protein
MIRILRYHRWRTMHTVLPRQRSKLASLLCSSSPVQRAGLEISGYIGRVMEMLHTAAAASGSSKPQSLSARSLTPSIRAFGTSIKIVSRRQ